MNTENQSTVKKNAKPNSRLDRKDYERLISTVKKYENRIKEIEGSMYWRTYQFFTKTKLILTSDSYLKSDKWRFFQRIRFLFSGPGLRLIKKFIVQFFSLFFGKVARLFKASPSAHKDTYVTYMEKFFPRTNDLEDMKSSIELFKRKPTISILAFVNDGNFKYLNYFLNSLEDQVYDKFRVTFITHQAKDKINYTLNKVIRNDEVYNTLEYEQLGEFISQNVRDYVLVADISCTLRADALFHFIKEYHDQTHFEYSYSDHDHLNIEDKIHSRPYFKPAYSPHTLWSRNYIGQVCFVSKQLLESIALPPFPNFYGLNLKLTEKSKHVERIPKILFHQIQQDLEVGQIEENHIILNQFLNESYKGAKAILSNESAGCFEPVLPLTDEEPLVSIIIPCKNKGSVLDVCLNSIFDKSTYSNFEIIIIDNGSTEKSFFSTVALWEYNYPTRVRCYTIDIPFNYSKLNNEAVKFAKGEYLLFLNNDTEVLSNNWIEEMLQYAQLNNVGMVGGKLLYPNNTLQHAGIVLNIDETGAHIYSGAYKETAGYFNNVNCLTNYSAVTGACMLIERTKFNQVGGFDESLAVDCNDVELCCKLLEKGYFNLYNPNVRLIHYECLTRGNPGLSSRSMVRQRKEKSYFIDKWTTYVDDDPFYNPNLSITSKNYELKISE